MRFFFTAWPQVSATLLQVDCSNKRAAPAVRGGKDWNPPPGRSTRRAARRPTPIPTARMHGRGDFPKMASPGLSSMSLSPEGRVKLLSAICNLVENTIVPLSRTAVASGSKLFGAAILSRTDLTPLSVAVNNEKGSPLLHAEINCIQQFFTVDFPEAPTRPSPRDDCLVFATHEPCCLCLSDIAWAGFREFYLFSFQDTRDLFSIPYDIQILHELFCDHHTSQQAGQRSLYNRSNRFFKGQSLADVVAGIDDGSQRAQWTAKIESIKGLYSALNRQYQATKQAGINTAASWS